MNKKEEFKEFASRHPELISVVRDKRHTWQELYEVYDLYGSDLESWNKFLNKTSDTTNNSVGELTKILKNVNIDSIQKYIDTAQKAIGIVQELSLGASGASVASGPSSPRPINKIFED